MDLLLGLPYSSLMRQVCPRVLLPFSLPPAVLRSTGMVAWWLPGSSALGTEGHSEEVLQALEPC